MIINKVKLEMIYVGRKTLVRLALVYVFKICCICLNVKEVKNEWFIFFCLCLIILNNNINACSV